MLKKTLAAVAFAATLAFAGTPAQAGHRGHHAGAAVGGFIAGAIVGSALARPRECYLARQRVWTGHRWVVRRVEVCD